MILRDDVNTKKITYYLWEVHIPKTVTLLSENTV